MSTLKQYFYEPLSTLTHLIAAVASLVGLVVLLLLTRHDLPKMISLLIYTVSMVLLYTASTLFHGVKTNDQRRFWLNRIDHMAIFLLIAGTYTPIAYNLFPPVGRWWVLFLIWLIAAVGMMVKLFSVRIHGWLNSFIYLIITWGMALPLALLSNVFRSVPVGGWLWLLLGGLIYTVGFVIYYSERPDPWPLIFGHHEIWHLFVMGGSLCHFLFMVWYVVPATSLAV